MCVLYHLHARDKWEARVDGEGCDPVWYAHISQCSQGLKLHEEENSLSERIDSHAGLKVFGHFVNSLEYYKVDSGMADMIQEMEILEVSKGRKSLVGPSNETFNGLIINGDRVDCPANATSVSYAESVSLWSTVHPYTRVKSAVFGGKLYVSDFYGFIPHKGYPLEIPKIVNVEFLLCLRDLRNLIFSHFQASQFDQVFSNCKSVIKLNVLISHSISAIIQSKENFVTSLRRIAQIFQIRNQNWNPADLNRWGNVGFFPNISSRDWPSTPVRHIQPLVLWEMTFTFDEEILEANIRLSLQPIDL